MGRTAAEEPADFIFLCRSARQLVGISVGIGTNQRRKPLQIQSLMVLGDCRPGAPDFAASQLRLARPDRWIASLPLRSSRFGGQVARNEAETHVFIPATRFRPGFASSLLPLGQRAQGKPGTDCARSPVCEECYRKAHGLNYRYSQDIPAFPAQWFGGLYALSPVSGLYCHRCRPRTGGADRRQGRGARTTRLRRTLQTFRPAGTIPPDAAASHRNPRQRYVTIAFRPLLEARAGQTSAGDLPDEARAISDFQITIS